MTAVELGKITWAPPLMGVVEMDRGGWNAGNCRSSPSTLRTRSGKIDRSIVGNGWRTASGPSRLCARSNRMDRSAGGSVWHAEGHGWTPSRLRARGGGTDRGVVRRRWDARDQRWSFPRMTRTSPKCFNFRIVASPSPGFGFFLSGVGVDAFETVLMVPLAAAAPLSGFVLLEVLLKSLILAGMISVGTF